MSYFGWKFTSEKSSYITILECRLANRRDGGDPLLRGFRTRGSLSLKTSLATKNGEGKRPKVTCRRHVVPAPVQTEQEAINLGNLEEPCL